MNFVARRKKTVEAARAIGLDALVITHGADVRWLTGFTGSNATVAISFARGARFLLVTDGRYTTQARQQAVGVRLKIEKKSAAVAAVTWLIEQGVTRCGFDSGHTTVAALDALRKALPAKVRRGFFQPAAGLIAKLRVVKDADEIAVMRRAAALGCALFDHLLGHMSAGIPENEVAAQLEFAARMAGAEAMSFETIVTSGERSSLPHGRATSARLPKRGFVTLDFGVLLDGYCSDMTRSVHIGAGTRLEQDVYHSVLDAQVAAVAAVAPGRTCAEVDEAARSVLSKAKLDKYFIHSTGHGVGLEIHEGPRLAAKQDQVLEAGMVITIEPGVYMPEKFGVRIEDMVLVTAKGCEVLTASSPKSWIEL